MKVIRQMRLATRPSHSSHVIDATLPSLPPFLTHTFERRGRKDEKLIKPPGSIEGQPFDMSDLEGCEVALLDHTDQVQVDGLKNC
eukprot:26121-Eustigmatos_ZCMA.PRE.1